MKFQQQQLKNQQVTTEITIDAKLGEAFEKISKDNYMYFVNSYYCVPKEKTVIVGQTNYGEEFASIVAKDNVVGMQFHPEKSGKEGFTLLNNFIKYYVN